jgi:hypothetical protein
MEAKKRYCEKCDGVNSGGFYDDICVIQEFGEYNKYLFDNGGGNYGCQVPAAIWREANERYGEWDCGFEICDKLAEQRKKAKK